MKSRIIIGASVFLILIVLGGIIFYLQYNKPHQGVKDYTPDASLTSNELFKKYSDDETSANTIYLNKVIEIKGEVSALTKNPNGDWNIIFQQDGNLNGINCTMEKNEIIEKITPGKKITLKGRCTGMLMDVVLIDCVIVNS